MTGQAKAAVSRSGDDSSFSTSFGRALISSGTPTQTYLGRVVIELWDGKAIEGATQAQLDANSLALLIDPAAGVDKTALLQRIASALPARVL